MSDYTKLIFGDTSELYRPATLQEVGRPLQMTMQGLNPDTSYFAYAELYENGVKTAQSLQQTFQTIRAGVITLTHVSDVRSGNNYVVTYSVSNTYALSSSIMSINGSPIQGVISGNTITYTVSGLTMGQTYSYSISTIDFYGETDTTSGSLVTVAQNYITITYASRTSSSVTFDLDYVSDGGFYEGYIEYWDSSKDPSTDQADGHTFFQDGADTVTQSNLDDGTTYKFRATIIQSIGGTEIYSNVVTQSTADIDYSGDYLTITSTSANNTIYFKSVVAWTTGSVDYSTDNGSTWSTVSGGTSGNGNTLATLGNGDKLILRSTNIRGGDNKLNASGSYTVSGNLASLQFGDNFNVSGQTAQSFSGFFKQTPVTSAKDLYLGAYSTMGASSFSSMFQNCTSLTTPPSSLPATTLANYCYQFMFNGCTSLTTSPSIAATSVPESALSNMFNGCTSLTTAPDLKQVTSVGTSGMQNMYYRCSSLATAYAPTVSTWSATDMSQWLRDVASSGVIHANATVASVIPPLTYNGCPEGWYVVVDNAQDVEWFTIKNEYAGDTTLTIKATQSGKEQTVDVSTDGTNWTSVTSTTSGVTLATIPQNGSVKLRHTGALGYNTITGDHEHSLQGNAISIDLGDVKKVLYRKSPDYMFYQLFSGDEKLISCRVDFDSYAAGGQNGMQGMFKNCTSLASMSNLNSFIIVYDSMFANAFDGCSYITTPPTFNSLTTLKRSVFRYAFQNSGLTEGVDLSGVESNWENAYECMYIGCTSLTDAGKLPQSIGGWNSCTRMYSGCTSLTTPPDASHLTTLNTTTFKSTFIGCTALEHGLDLSNVTTANNNCLQETYAGCRSLQYVIAPSIGTWNEAYTTNWLNNVGASGTIYADSATAATITSDSTSGCPTGWNVVVA